MAAVELQAAVVERGYGELLERKVEDGRDWLCFEHHGNETGYNKYNHAGLVIMWGVLHDEETVTASKLVAGSGNLDAYVSRDHRDDLHRSERRTRFFQAISRSRLRNQLKRMRGLIASKDAEGARKVLSPTLSLIERSLSKGILHRNTAARYKSRLSRQVVALGRSR